MAAYVHDIRDVLDFRLAYRESARRSRSSVDSYRRGAGCAAYAAGSCIRCSLASAAWEWRVGTRALSLADGSSRALSRNDAVIRDGAVLVIAHLVNDRVAKVGLVGKRDPVVHLATLNVAGAKRALREVVLRRAVIRYCAVLRYGDARRLNRDAEWDHSAITLRRGSRNRGWFTVEEGAEIRTVVRITLDSAAWNLPAGAVRQTQLRTVRQIARTLEIVDLHRDDLR